MLQPAPWMYAIFVLFVLTLGIIWFLLPFAIFGIKPRLDRLIAEQQIGNELLRRLLAERHRSPGE